MFDKCPKNDNKICDFALIRNDVIYCGLADSNSDPNGESRVSEMKYCPLIKLKERKKKRRK